MYGTYPLKTAPSDPDESINDGVRRFGLGTQAHSTRADFVTASSTEDQEFFKSVQVDPPSTVRFPQTTTRHFAFVPDEYWKPVKNWEGIVESVGEKRFTAIMRDLDTARDRGDSRFDIDIEDVDAGDRDLLVPGGIFYLTVGYRMRRGTRIKGMQIVFRRLPAWTGKAVQRTQSRAQELFEILQTNST